MLIPSRLSSRVDTSMLHQRQLKGAEDTSALENATHSSNSLVRALTDADYTNTTAQTSRSHCPLQTRHSRLPEADPGGRRGGDPVRGGGPGASSVSAPAARAGTAPRRGGRRLAEEIGDALDDVHRPRSGASSSGTGSSRSASPPRRGRRRRRGDARRGEPAGFDSNPIQQDAIPR